MVHALELYFRKGTDYDLVLEGVRRIMLEIADRWKAGLVELDVDRMSSEEQLKAVNDIRSIPPQVRGRIVSSRGKVLPLSGSKLLNVANTPVVVLRKNSRAIDVFPHLLGTTYFDLVHSLNRIQSLGPSEYAQSRGMLEDPIVKIVSDDPSLIEQGMIFVGANVELSVGAVDLILRDRVGLDVIVEVETKAGDQAVGQVLRLARGYAEQTGKSSVRKAIICVDRDGNLPLACKEAGIDLFRLGFLKVGSGDRSV